jgi:hypothetical protein
MSTSESDTFEFQPEAKSSIFACRLAIETLKDWGLVGLKKPSLLLVSTLAAVAWENVGLAEGSFSLELRFLVETLKEG